MKSSEAYINWNAGICYVREYPSQFLIASGKNWRAAVLRARKKGYRVRVYCDAHTVIPKGAVRSPSRHSYVFPPIKKEKKHG